MDNGQAPEEDEKQQEEMPYTDLGFNAPPP